MLRAAQRQNIVSRIPMASNHISPGKPGRPHFSAT